MNKVKKVIGLVCLAALFAIGLYGCGGDNPTATPLQPTATTAAAPTNTTAPVAAPTDTTAPVAAPTDTTATTSGGGGNSGDAVSLLQQSSTAMKSVKSYHIVLKTTSGGGNTAEGDFVLPDKARLVISTTAGSSTAIVIGGDLYTQVPGSDAYYQIPGQGAGLLQGASTTGALADIAENATVVGDETLDGVATTHVKFTYNQDKATAMAAQALGQPIPTPSVTLGEANADAWVEKSTGYIHQFSSTSTVAGATDTTTVTFSKFNEDVNPPIAVPANVQQLPSAPGAGTTPTP